MATATRTALTELTDFCELTYGVPRLETRILVSTYLPTRYPPLWLFVDAEKCRFLEDLEYAVRRLEHPAILDTWLLKGQRAYLANKYVKVLMSERHRKTHLFANRYWDWPGPSITRRSWYQLVAAECLRLRLTYNAAKQPGSLARENLFELVRGALGEAAVDRGGIVPRELSETVYRRATLLPMIDRDLTSPTSFMRNLGFVPANHAAICGRAQPDEEDFGVQRFMLRNCIPRWIEKLLKVLIKHGLRGMLWRDLMRATDLTDEWFWHYGGPNNMDYPSQIGKRIIAGFFSSGLCDRSPHRYYSLKAQYFDDLEHIFQARA
jgi:hypothetical protein